MEASISWKPQDMSRPKMGEIYLHCVWKHRLNIFLNGMAEDNRVYLRLD
jgi:hypothetical protein